MTSSRSSERPPGADASGDCRCLCGSLVARLGDDGIELKCRRCKRVLLIPVANPLAKGWGEVELVPLARGG